MYLIFGGVSYYPQGGCNDLLDYVKGEEYAINLAENLIGKYAVIEEWESSDGPENYGFKIQWTQVACTDGTIIKEFGKCYGQHTPIIKII